MPMSIPRPRSRQPKQLDAGIFQAEISSYALRLAAEGKAAKTIRTYTEAVRWFAAARLPSRASWEQASSQDIQRWMAWLLDRHSSAYASNQYRALQQFFKWLAAEDELPDPMAGLQPPRHRQAGPGLHARGAGPAGAGVRGPQLRPAPRYRDHRGIHRDRHPAVRTGQPPVQRRRPVAAGDHCPRQRRQAPDRPDRPPGRPEPGPVPARPHPARAGLAAEDMAQSPQPGAADRASMYQMTARRGQQCGLSLYPHRFRHHFSHTWLDRGGPRET